MCVIILYSIFLVHNEYFIFYLEINFIMTANFTLIQSIVEHDLEKDYEQLFGLYEYNNHAIIHVIIQTSIEHQYLPGLKLVFKPIFHRNDHDEISFISTEIANQLIFQKKYDLIIPCVLNSYTTMYAITECLLKTQHCSLVDYLTTHSMSLDYQALNLHLPSLFANQSGLNLAHKLKPYIQFTQASFERILETSLNNNHFEAINYLLKYQPKRMQFQLTQYGQALSEKKDKSMYSKDNFLAFINLNEQTTHPFLIQFLSLLQKDYGFKFNDLSNEYVVGMFVTYQSVEDNQKVYDFLTDLYQLQHSDIPRHMIDYVAQDSGYTSFAAFYEMKEFNASISQSDKPIRKIKL